MTKNQLPEALIPSTESEYEPVVESKPKEPTSLREFMAWRGWK